MSSTIYNAFITQCEAEGHMAYQRQGSKLKNLIRVVNGVSGESVKFQKVGTGEATTKARHAEVVAMNISHTNVTATLSDYYASDYVDKLDELKTNIDERSVIATTAAYALGRKTDSIITDAPVDNEGKGEAFSPTDLIATSLASCILTIMGIVAKRENLDLKGTKAEVDKIMLASPRRINEIRIKIFLNKNFEEDVRKKLEKAALSCPVRGSLNKDINETIKFIYPL